MSMFLTSLVLSMLPLWAIGALTIFHWFKAPRDPSDSSNRINNIKSWWNGLTRPEREAHLHRAFRQDELKNIEDVDMLHNLIEELREIVQESKDVK